MTDEMIPLSGELDPFRGAGGMFDVEPVEMDANIGRRCVFIEPACMIEREDTFTVATVQKNYRGDLCYRIVGDTDVHNFGQCCHPSRIRFID